MVKLLQKYKTLNIYAKSALWFTICSFLQKGISFITVPIFTRVMSTEQYGIYTIYLSWLQIFTVISSLYLYYGVTDNAMSKFENNRDQFISSMQGLTMTITTGVVTICILFLKNIQHFLGLAPIMIFLMFAEIYVTPAFSFWAARQRFEYRYRSLVLTTLVRSILNPVLGLAAVSFADDKAMARAISTVFVEFIVCLPILILQFSKGKVFYRRDFWKYGLTLAIPMLPHYLSGIILNQGDRIMISRMIGSSEAALYGVAYSIGMLVQLFVNALNNAVTPWVYSKLKINDFDSIRRRSGGLMIIIFIIAIGLMLISPELVLIFGSSKYADSVFVIPPVAGSVFFIFLYSYLSFPEFYYEKTAFLMIASVFAAVLNLLLNYFFLNKYGFVAAAYTTLVCYVLYSIGHFLVGRSILCKQSSEHSIVDNKIMLLLSTLIVLSSSFIQFLFPYPLLRYTAIFSGAVFAFVQREKIIKVIKE